MQQRRKNNRHGRCFKKHLQVQHNLLIGIKKPSGSLAKLKKDLKAFQKSASDARVIGAAFKYSFGGSYDIVAGHNADVRSDLYLEANHSPPCDAYTGTDYDSALSYGARPAHAMLFYHHRAPKGLTGGLTSTGGSSFNKEWAAKLRELLIKGDYAKSMFLDFNDILATTTPNRGFYALALHRTALYARYIGLIDEKGLELIVPLYGHLLKGNDFGAAFTDADESH